MAFIIVEERGVRRHVAFPHSGRLTIGRAPDNDIPLMDEKSSRHHAVVEQSQRGYLVRDLNSLNGCYMNGLRIREQPLRYGETFTIGRARMTLETEQSTAIDVTGANSRIALETGHGTEPSNGAPETAVAAAKSGKGDTSSTGRPVSTPGLTPIRPLTTKSNRVTDLPETDISRALSAFARSGLLDDGGKLMDAVCEFVGRLVPSTRVCIALPIAGELRPRHFHNFITSSPASELPRDFAVTANKSVSSARILIQQVTDAPVRAYLPVRLSGGEPMLVMLERERLGDDFPPQERALLASLAPLLAVLSGVRVLMASREEMQQTQSRLETELAKLTEDLQGRLDLQTAELTRQRDDLSRMMMHPQFRYDYSGIIGRSRPMVELFHLLDKVTDLPVPVLIIGESGTGKELIARALHFNSRRAGKGQFVAENCAALPEPLLESELFGHVKGAFTGADRDKIGLFEQASGGTILLDEMGETTASLQAKLLRVLEEGEIRPVGGTKVKKVDFRLVAATNRPLEDWVKQGKFRQDLYYRLAVITVVLPPLRERKEDIPLLVDHFLKEAAEGDGGGKIRATSGVMRALMEYPWPGNVRELENEVRRMVALSDGRKLTIDALSPAVRGTAREEDELPEDLPLKDLVERIEVKRIQEVIRETGGNKSRAAEKLGLSRLGLRKKMERYGIADDGIDDEA